MPKLKKRIAYQGLDKYNVYKEDTDNSIFNIQNVPNIFPLGKSYFLILGSLSLKQESDILVEIIDAGGNTVYYEIPRYLEATGRAISVWVFSRMTPGPATITILGQLENVPKEWKGKYNVKRTLTVVINPLISNSEPIRFETPPVVSSSTADRAHLYMPESVTYLQTYTNALYNAYGEYIPAENKYKVHLYTLAVPPTTPPIAANGLFTLGNLTVGGATLTSSYSASYELIAPDVFYVDPPPFVLASIDVANRYLITYGSDTNRRIPHYIYNFDDNTGWAMHYQSTDTGSLTVFTSSFAKINIDNLQTFSGKIDSVKVFKKSLSDVNYSLMGEFPATPLELFISRSNSIDNLIGKFDTQIWLAQNWTSSSITGGATVDATYVQKTDINLYESMFMSQSTSNPESFKVYPKNTNIQLNANSEYSVYMNIAGQLDSTTGTNAEMNVYISGSAVRHTILDDHLGKKIAKISATRQFTNFGQQIFNFVSDELGTGALVFEIVSGKWNVSDISLKHASDEGFNPDNLIIYVPLNNIKRNEIANFKVEFLNSKKESSYDIIETVVPTFLKNNPVYIDLEDNIITGSIHIGRDASSGIELAGKDAPRIKSIEYPGFTDAISTAVGGFLAYSGSPEELSDSVFDGYSGVGFELHTGEVAGPNPTGGSLAFRYDPTNGSYLIITASLYALPGSNVATGSGGGGGTGSAGLWTASVDGTYIDRLSDVKISGSLYLSRSLYDADGSSGSDGAILSSDPNGLAKWTDHVKAPSFLGIAVSNEYTPITSSATYVAMYMPHDFTLEDIKASLSVSGSADLTLDVLKNGASLLSGNYITISGSVYTGSLEDINTALLANDRIDVQVITDGSGSSGLKVYLVGSSSLSLVYTASYAISASYAGSASWIESSSYAATASYLAGATSGLWTASLDGTKISRYSDVEITGSETIIGSLIVDDVGGGTTIHSDVIYISGSSDIQIGKIDSAWIRVLQSSGVINLSGSISVNNSLLDIAGPTHIGSLLTNIHQLTGSLYITGSQQISGSLTVKNSVDINGNLTSSNTNLFGEIHVLKNTYLGDNTTDKVEVTGSFNAYDMTGSLFGTSSWAESASNAISASYAPSAGAGLWTASLDGTYISRLGNVWVTGSLDVTGPFTSSGDNTLGGLRVVKNTYLGDGITDRTEVTGTLNVSDGITGSLDGTASYAAISAYAAGAGSSSQAVSSSYSLSSSYAVSASWAPGTGGSSGFGGYASQSFSNSPTWSFAHNLTTTYPVFEIYDNSQNVIIPSEIIVVNANNSLIQFPTSQSGYAVASVGGNTLSASYAESSSYALSASWAPGGSTPGGSGVGDKIFLWQNFN